MKLDLCDEDSVEIRNKEVLYKRIICVCMFIGDR